jgi:ectoine hydroxylase-related dioxygenase (phytanoyl-CoA dioxygenase family)
MINVDIDFEYKNYNTTVNELTNTLDTFGVAVIPNILTNNECIEYRNGIWDELENLTSTIDDADVPFDRNNTNSYGKFFKLYPMHSMLLQHYGIGHLQNIWNIRQHENVCNIFSNVWNAPNEELLVSFDGMSLCLPPEYTNKGWFNKNWWFHTDQSFKLKGKHCIQGIVTLYDVKDGDASLAILEGSHKYHRKFGKKFNKLNNKSDWYKLNTNDEYQFYFDNDCEMKIVKASRGSIILWDSRTIHQGIGPQKNRDRERFRMVVYVCMTPRINATQTAINKKINAFNELRTTNHWPHRPKLFSKNPRTYGNPLPLVKDIETPYLTELGKKLAGF